MSDNWSNLAKVVYKRTYARNDNDKLENWNDTVERVIKGNIRNHNVSQDEINRLEYFMLNRKAMPAGRGLWFSGAPSHDKLGGAALNNCWGLTAHEWENFVLAQDLLMLGGGVGLSVEHRFVSKLPKVKKNITILHKETKDADFIIPDSREGWCQLTYNILESFFVTGKSFTFSSVCLRGFGEKINGFGGVSSGPIPLISFVKKLIGILVNRQGKHIRPVDAMDIICSIGEMVVSGNVRRSAILIMGDPWDKEFLKSKRWDLGNIPTERAMANLSVACENIEDLHPLFWKTYEQGEPFGLVNIKNIQKYGRMGELKKDNAVIVNPCQPGFATVLTPDGIRYLNEVNIGDKIWSGTKWTTIVNKWSTGIKKVYKYNTTTGYFLGTKNHRIVENQSKIEVQNAENIDWNVGPINYNLINDLNPQDIMDGLVIGDGSKHKASNNLIGLHIGKKDTDYFNSEINNLIIKYRPGITPTFYMIKTTIDDTELKRTYERKVPERFFKGDNKKKLGFLRGLFSANGSVAGKRVTLKQTSYELIQQVQEMLSSVGIHSYITVNKTKSNKFSNDNYIMKQSYGINITSGKELFKKQIGFIQKYKQNIIENGNTNKYYTSKIKNIEEIGEFEVYDLTVDDKNHTYWTGCCLVSNCAEACLEDGEPCNLQEIFLPNLKDENEFIEAAKLMHRYGKRVTCEKYHNIKNDKVVKRNRRIGTGITGCLQSNLFNPKTLNKVYKEIQKENTSYSKELNIPESIKTTVIKPSGTLSLLGDVTPGIHPAYSPYYIRRVRFSSVDPLVNILKEANHPIELVKRFDGSLDHNTTVVDFYCKTPKGTPTATTGYDSWKQLEDVKMAQKYWADQSISVTVYYKKEEIIKVKEWLIDNFKYLKTISFLCHNDHGFEQAPLEEIDEKTYNINSSKIKQLSNIESTLEDKEGIECEGGMCPIK